MTDDYDNPFDDEDRWGDEKSIPSEWKEGNAWAKCRIISPRGLDIEMELPKLSPGQGQMLNILLMRIADNQPVEVSFQGEDGKVVYTEDSEEPVVMK